MITNKKVKLSIIICTYNAEKRLAKTLDSILKQRVNDYEVIIVDGKSGDGTIEIVKEYAKKFERKLRWISELDSGIYNAMNKGVKMAQGKYLNIVGAGDWLEEGALKKIYKCIRNNPRADAVYGVLRMWEKDLKKNHLLQTHPNVLDKTPMQHPALYYKKTLHNVYGLYDESYDIVADYLFCMKAFFIGSAKATPINVVVDNYVLDGISIDIAKCERENLRARRSLKLVPTRLMTIVNLLVKKINRGN